MATSPSKDVKAPRPFKTPNSHFRLDLARISREQRQEALRSTINDVDLMERYGMHHFFSLLELALRTLDKSDTGTHGIIISRPREGPSQFCDTMGRPVDGNHITSRNFFFLQRLDHASTCVSTDGVTTRLSRDA